MKNVLLMLLLLPLIASGQISKVVAKYPIDDPSIDNLNDGILGRWRFQEDTDKRNFYEVIRGNPYASDKYHLKFWNRGGTNPTYEANMHFSKIGNTLFINVPYFEDNFSHSGFFFLKILETNPEFTKITATVIHDVDLWNLNQEEIKQRIVRNISNPSFYLDTVHFYKLK